MTAIDFDAFFENYRTTVHAKDVDGFLSIYADDIREFDMWADWSRDGIATLRGVVEGWFGSLGTERVVVGFTDIATHPGTDLAAATAIISFSAVSETGETLRSMENRLTWVAARTPEGWRIVHQHTSSPIDPPTGSVKFHRAG
jgi:ketosteroid isomerase-like protein